MIGKSIAHYEITGRLGEGGMGEVYRATDTRLQREVALKILPEQFAADSGRMARFEREAQVLASLNHPHIGAIHGIEEAGATKALVLELVEGPTLADRIARGPLPLEEARKVALQMAEALEAAHERGVVHRDLKPANIKITPEGQVKVLDFGLAKAAERDPVSSPDATRSPTLTLPATEAGVILGTAAYMSPEQARGQEIDKRSDIWSFGLVFFEMLTGKAPFREDTVSDSLAAVLRARLDFELLPAGTPAAVRRLLERCLQRDARKRLRDIGEARIALEETDAAEPGPPPADATPGPEKRRMAPAAVVPWVILGLMVLFVAWRQWGGSGPETAPADIAFSIQTEGWDLPVNFIDTPILDISRDGRRFAWIARSGNSSRLFVRSLDDAEARMIPGTEGATCPFFSPDGEWIGFFAAAKLKKVPFRGGNPLDVTSDIGGLGRGAWWGEGHRIVLAASYDEGLSEVSDSGGAITPVTTLDEAAAERTHRFPQVLPGGDAILVTIGFVDAPSAYDDAHIAVFSRSSERMKTLVEGGHMGRYVDSGHLLFMRAAALYAVPFDLDALEVTGDPVLISDAVGREASSGAGYYAVSRDGTLFYRPVSETESDLSLVLADREGNLTKLGLEGSANAAPRFSPDGRRIAYATGGGGTGVVNVFDVASRVETRLTLGGNGSTPIWSPDGSTIFYTDIRPGREGGIYSRAWDGSSAEKLIRPGKDVTILSSSASDGGRLLVTVYVPTIHNRLVFLEGSEAGRDRPVGTGQGYQWGAVFSPDDRWIAYSSNESGVDEVYVEPVEGEGRWQVSDDGGMGPVWSGDGSELFYADHRGIYRVPVLTTGRNFRPAPPELLFAGRFSVQTAPTRNFDVSRDGQRFILLGQGEGDEAGTGLTVRLNWFDELRRLAGS